MLRLNLRREPYWLQGPLMKAFGVRLKVKPLDATLAATAQSAALREITELANSIKKIKDAGGDVTGLPDINDPAVRTGMATAITTRYFGVYGIIEWEGVHLEDGELAEVSPKNVADLLNVPGMNKEFADEYNSDYERMSAEKNVSSTAPNGTTVAGGNTADIVPNLDLPVQEAKQLTESSAPTPNTESPQ